MCVGGWRRGREREREGGKEDTIVLYNIIVLMN